MNIDFRPAKYFFETTAPRKISLVVFHCAVVPQNSRMAEWLLKYCAEIERKASWHYAVDDDSITQSVKEKDVAYHAAGVNPISVGIELAMPGEPSAADWATPYAKRMLTLAEWLAAGVCFRSKIDPVFVDAAGIKEGRRGITTHAEVSLAFPERASRPAHMDPGIHFPMNKIVGGISDRLLNGNFDSTLS